MLTEQDYIDEIDAAIAAGISHSYSATGPSPSAFPDIFEGYVWSLVVRAAHDEGATVRYEDVLGASPPAALVFRTAPGAIYSRRRSYTHAVISFPGIQHELEAHIGIYVSGQSGVIHECDVVVLSRSEATICRNGNVHPRASKALITAECKYYATNLGINLARSFLGLRLDIKRDNRFFVSNTSSESVETLIADHKAQRGLNLNLMTQNEVNHLKYQFVTAFKNFKARGGKF